MTPRRPRKPGLHQGLDVDPAPMQLLPAAEARLRRLEKFKRDVPATMGQLGSEMVSFFKNTVQKRQTKLAKIAECFAARVPEPLIDHCCIESLHAGTLTVLVDTSSHLYDLKSLLLAGLQDQLLLACRPAGLRKINLKPGRWYEGDGDDRKIQFR